ncbi:MAG: RNA polymerase sigma-70 factor [Opitutaceae bacterium]|nr:RNA polymerase sigma-70 factor [Opitutaceae bacterium]
MIEVFTAHRSLLFGIAYRMLGQVGEAEDAVQDVWLRWRKQDPAAVTSAKAWLVAATTRLCIDRLRSARRQREQYYGIWLPEPLVPAVEVHGGTAAELADSLSMAFMLMLEALEPTERAVFLLREVFDYDYAEIAEIVGKSEANCRQIVRRAKQSLQDQPPSAGPPTEHARQLVELFLAATASGDVNQVLSLLSADSTVLSDGGGRVKAAGRPILGADHVSRFLLGIWPRFIGRMQRRAVTVNGRPGLLLSLAGEVQYAFSFDIAADRVRAIYIICNPDKLRHLAHQ